jgi:hypothetical protein
MYFNDISEKDAKCGSLMVSTQIRPVSDRGIAPTYMEIS